MKDSTPACAKILLVEDHAGIAQTLRGNLEVDGHVVSIAHDGAEGLAICNAWRPDLVILDLMLPDMSGFDVLQSLRRDSPDLPVLILSAIGAEMEKVRGFSLGADDYVTKPFGLMELLARVQALLRRRQRAESATYTFGDIVIDVDARRVRRREQLVSLRPREFDLLLTLVRQAGRVLSKEELLRSVWGYGPDVMSRTVDTHILELRRALEDDPASPRYIKTRRGFGYVLET